MTSAGDELEHIESVLASPAGPSPATWKRIYEAYRARYEDKTAGSLEEGLGLKVSQGGDSYAEKLKDARRLRALREAVRQVTGEEPPYSRFYKTAGVFLNALESFERTWSGEPLPTHASALNSSLEALLRTYPDLPRTTPGLVGALKRVSDLTE